ncbi:MAG TPA: cytochrome B6, partial [Candidatus Dormibacteraeota bacterium]|nr:cytochrome B6 [Candidatus Dormibacteraeota bacterium]
QRAAAGNSDLAAQLDAWSKASADQQGKWATAYTGALAKATVKDSQITSIPDGDYGPLTVMMASLLSLAQAGSLDGLLQVNGRFYQTDYTPSLLFMGDGGYLSGLAQQANLTGSQWGMMNETGSYPGQTWLWLYTMWYQVPPFNSSTGFLGINSGNADLGIIILMTLLTAALALIPFISVLRDIPRWIPIHRLIWKDFYSPKVRT